MQEMTLPWVLTKGGPVNATEVLSLYTYKLAFQRWDFGLASASGVLWLVLVAVFAFVAHALDGAALMSRDASPSSPCTHAGCSRSPWRSRSAAAVPDRVDAVDRDQAALGSVHLSAGLDPRQVTFAAFALVVARRHARASCSTRCCIAACTAIALHRHRRARGLSDVAAALDRDAARARLPARLDRIPRAAAADLDLHRLRAARRDRHLRDRGAGELRVHAARSASGR